MLGGAFVGFFDARGVAYLPTLVAPTISNNPLGFAVSMVVAMVAACMLTIIANKVAKKKGIENVQA
ncbi:hypothetical protein Pelsub_P0849 [Pelolinea submarina]|nr:hypothetical protein Pelsub_P0849 [Pelolinea submarina]